ncbi:MAG: tetraacyldisaccharide 4'-kinase [Pseudomonadota bacterium]
MISESRLNQIWYEGGTVPWYLSWLERLYRVLRPFQQRWQKLRAAHPGVPVVVVGNLTVGGTGKTPLIVHLAQRLAARSVTVGVVSRGYGSSAGPGPVEVSDDSPPAAVGDEPLLIRQTTGVPVVVGSDRLAGCRHLVDRHGVTLILADDGLQHRRLKRDLEIVVVDHERGFGNGRLLPAGPLREPPNQLGPDVITVRNGDDMKLALKRAGNIKRGGKQALTEFCGRPVVAMAGIGRPERFFQALEQEGLTIERNALPDHVNYQHELVADLIDKTVLTTSKDAVKLRDVAGEDWWEVPVEVTLNPTLDARLEAQLEGLLS